MPNTFARCVPLWLVMACDFPTRSASYACETTADCRIGRTCEDGYCVRSEVDAGTADMADSAPSIDMAFMDANAALVAQCLAAGYTFEASPNGYYRAVTNDASWGNAQAACAADVPGASHLIVLSTTAEVAYMQTELGWIGLSDRLVEGQFVTVTGETGDQRPWASGQPNNASGTEDCAQMRSDLVLYDDQCSNAHRYVCECDGRASTP